MLFRSFSPDGSRLASGSDNNTVRLWDGVTGAPIDTFKGHPQSVYSLSRSPVESWLGPISTGEILKNRDGDIVNPLCTSPHSFSSSEISISLCKSKGRSRRYCIQGTVPSSTTHIPLLWLPVDISAIVRKAFCSKAAAFGFQDGRVIILDLTPLNLQGAVTFG